MTRFSLVLVALVCLLCLSMTLRAENTAEILDPNAPVETQADNAARAASSPVKKTDVPASGAVDEPGFKASVKFGNRPAPKYDWGTKNTNQIPVPGAHSAWAVPLEEGYQASNAAANSDAAELSSDEKNAGAIGENISPALAAAIAREKAGAKGKEGKEREKEGKEIVAMYRAVVEAEKDNPAAHYRLGLALVHNGDAQHGLVELETAIAMQPKNGKYLCDYGILALRAGWVEKAFAACQAAVSLAPENARYVSALGDVHLAAEHLPEAADAYSRAIKLDPQNSGYLYNLGLTYLHARDFNKAAEILNEAVKMKPTYAPYYCSRGLAFENSKNVKQAMEDYLTAIKLDKNNAYAHYLFAGVFSDPDDPTYTNRFQAVEHAEKAVKLSNYKNAQYLMGLARALRVAHNMEQAVEAARKAVELEPAREDYRKELAQYQQLKMQGLDK
ncbi:MAG TPA: tetratricopeptide repeat protein [Planctomycetota bacterium]|nr:tetratricopeptide repeat protein [Planctomycetota bacterium]